VLCGWASPKKEHPRRTRGRGWGKEPLPFSKENLGGDVLEKRKKKISGIPKSHIGGLGSCLGRIRATWKEKIGRKGGCTTKVGTEAKSAKGGIGTPEEKETDLQLMMEKGKAIFVGVALQPRKDRRGRKKDLFMGEKSAVMKPSGSIKGSW